MDGALLIPGMLVSSKYELLRPLARGAMGEVWIATHTTLGGEMAIKFLSRGPTHDGEDEATAMARFRFEAQVAAKLSRKTRHIVAVTDHGEEYGYAYLVMELVEGESLEKVMFREGTCALRTIAPIVAQVAKGLAHAHADGVFHRDLKPANILISKDEDGQPLVKILDFGIAKAARSHKITGAHEPNHTTEIGIVLGTPNYMSPEQARGLASLDHRCDLWALATIAYEALTSKLPYDGETTADLLVNICSVDPIPVRTFRPDLPESIEPFFKKGFAASPGKRFQTANELAEAFDKLAHGETAPVVKDLPATPAEPLPRLQLVEERSNDTGAIELSTYEPPRRRTGVFVVLGAVAALVVIVLAVRMSQSPAKTNASPPPEPTTAATPTIALPPPTEAPSASVEQAAATTSASAPKPSAKPTVVHKPTAAPIVPPSPAPTPTSKKPVDKGEIL